MKILLYVCGILLVFTLVTSDAVAQQGRGGAGKRGGGSGGSATQTRDGRGGQPDRGSQQAGKGPNALRQNQGQKQLGSQSPNSGQPDFLRIWEEEKLARDVYSSLATTSKLTIFRNIARSENQHMQSIERLIRTGGANAGQLNDKPGLFAFAENQQLYESLIAAGSRSPLDALMVGARIEEMDIADLKRLAAQTIEPRARQTLNRLMRGSENHLRAFAGQIAGQGASYRAEFLTQAEFDAIAKASGKGEGPAGNGRGINDRGQQAQSNGRQLGTPPEGNAGPGFGSQNGSGQGKASPGKNRRGRNR
ncbi:DUF2202 domain-containing protein [Roseiconus nitratireducens]|uniref:DUF2202 domain-containing protein n=1 Tax=Roseiconus nitratireducens TaxID=2605748 RepID=A0A5M6D1U0_9BACT|nr:DUF2202 domain-containing protein [Roseiconus nitratireducens]KAA5541454.1 DUF2202 domain-containing protein [Roseiconus nitratireducens]